MKMKSKVFGFIAIATVFALVFIGGFTRYGEYVKAVGAGIVLIFLFGVGWYMFSEFFEMLDDRREEREKEEFINKLQ